MNHKFVEFIPEKIDENILYISIEYNVAKHLCPCGCKDEIVTTLSPKGWSMHYNGETVSLSPSIGNWTHKCKSHYYIKNDKVQWLRNDYSKYELDKIIREDKNDILSQRKSKRFSFVKDRIKKYFTR